MTKTRIYELAKELGIDNKTVVNKAKDLGFDVKNHMSSLEDTQVEQIKGSFRSSSAPAKKQERPAKKSSKIKISLKKKFLVTQLLKMKKSMMKLRMVKVIEKTITFTSQIIDLDKVKIALDNIPI